MPDDPPRPAARDHALFILSRALDNRQHHQTNARVAAEALLGKLEQSGLFLAQHPPIRAHSDAPGQDGSRKWPKMPLKD